MRQKFLECLKTVSLLLLIVSLPTMSLAQNRVVDNVIQGVGGKSLRETFSNEAAEIAIRNAREQAAREASERLARQTPVTPTQPPTSPHVNNGADLASHVEDVQALIAKKREDAARAASQQPNQQSAIANMRQGIDQVPQGKQREELGAAIHNAEQQAGRKASDSALPTPRVTSAELQEFRNRQALRGPKDTKQDVATKSKTLPGPKLEVLKDRRVINSFAGRQYKNRQLSQDTIMYKYHDIDNRTGQKVTWLTNKKYNNEGDLRKDLAIRKDWGVEITHVSQFKVPKGTWVSEGKAASQGQGYPGGGYQAVVQNVPRAWLERTDRAFR